MRIAPDGVPSVGLPGHVHGQHRSEILTALIEALPLFAVSDEFGVIADGPIRRLPPVFPGTPAPARKAAREKYIVGIGFGHVDGVVKAAHREDGAVAFIVVEAR